MSSETVRTLDPATLRAVVAKVLELTPDEVGDDDALVNDLEMDSLAFLELAIALEGEYGVKVEDADLKACGSVTDLHALVARRVGEVDGS